MCISTLNTHALLPLCVSLLYWLKELINAEQFMSILVICPLAIRSVLSEFYPWHHAHDVKHQPLPFFSVQHNTDELGTAWLGTRLKNMYMYTKKSKNYFGNMYSTCICAYNLCIYYVNCMCTYMIAMDLHIKCTLLHTCTCRSAVLSPGSSNSHSTPVLFLRWRARGRGHTMGQFQHCGELLGRHFTFDLFICLLCLRIGTQCITMICI